jgi:hypothetical protein
MHDLAEGVFHPHLPEPELAQFHQGLMRVVVQGDIHGLSPHLNVPGRGRRRMRGGCLLASGSTRYARYTPARGRRGTAT